MRPTTERRLRTVAAVYRLAVRAARPPTRTVAEQLGVTHTHAANLIARARRESLLPATTRGRVGPVLDNDP